MFTPVAENLVSTTIGVQMPLAWVGKRLKGERVTSPSLVRHPTAALIGRAVADPGMIDGDRKPLSWLTDAQNNDGVRPVRQTRG